MQANRKIHLYVSEKAPFKCCPAAKQQKRSKFREKPVDFFHGTTRALTLALETILLT